MDRGAARHGAEPRVLQPAVHCRDGTAGEHRGRYDAATRAQGGCARGGRAQARDGRPARARQLPGRAIDNKRCPDTRKNTHRTGSSTETFVAIKASSDNWRWERRPSILSTASECSSGWRKIVINSARCRTRGCGSCWARLQPPGDHASDGREPALDLMAKVTGEG